MEVRIGKRTRKQWGATLIGVLGLIMLSTSVFGSGFETHEQGAKAVAMGGAFTAEADDPSAVFYNPAGITQLEGTQASLGVSVIRPYGKFQSNGNPAMGSLPGDTTSNKTRYYFIPNDYITYKLGTHFGSLTVDLAYNYVKDETRKWNDSAGDVNVGPITLTRVAGKFVDGSAHVVSASIGYKF